MDIQLRVIDLEEQVLLQEKELKKIKQLLQELVGVRMSEAKALEEFVKRLHY